ncbi:MAG: hypothetical protein PHP85_13050 [Gallionella sp.]|nr:hypothetical protein [Gallionella sp.]
MADKISTVIAATVMAALLSACSKTPPKCSDDETIDLVRKIIMQQMDSTVIGDDNKLSETEIQENMKIELPRAQAFDEKIRKYSCEAKLVAGGEIQLPITYESQLDDQGQHVVFVGGISMADLFAVGYGLMNGVKKSRPAKSDAAPQPQPAPAKSTTPNISDGQSRTGIVQDMIEASKKAVATYKTEGVSGMTIKTEECYSNLDKQKFFCGYLDLAARRIDQSISEAQHFPQSEFFADAKFGERIVKVFALSNMSQEQSNEYLRTVTPEINKLVDAELSK